MNEKRLLIIDDEPEIGAIIGQVAEDCGFEVAATTSAEAFKAAYATFRPSAIMMDLAVPNIDGIELFRWLADEQCATPILLVSGFGGRILESAQRLGKARGLVMRGIISKPMRLADIRASLDTLPDAR